MTMVANVAVRLKGHDGFFTPLPTPVAISEGAELAIINRDNRLIVELRTQDGKFYNMASIYQGVYFPKGSEV